jgi:hypothetical protein
MTTNRQKKMIRVFMFSMTRLHTFQRIIPILSTKFALDVGEQRQQAVDRP